MTARWWASYCLAPVRFAGCGVIPNQSALTPPIPALSHPDGWQWISEEQFKALLDTSEPSKVIAEWLGLPYQKYLEPDPGSQANVVELVADGGRAWDQPCRFGHRVEDYAVYCHNSRWIDSPRKCHRRQNASWFGPAWPHQECPGYEPNPSFVENSS